MAARLLPASRTSCRILERHAFLELLQMANRLVDPAAIARQLVVVARYLSRCQAVAIRLPQGPGYAYAASQGFPKRCLPPGDDLCARDADGRLLRDSYREPVPACLCGQLLRGQVNAAHPGSTPRGSLILAAPEGLSASPFGPHLPGHTLNPHHVAGFETVGLFPMVLNRQVFGLIQCNDRRPGRFTEDAIDLMEHLAASAANLLAIALP